MLAAPGEITASKKKRKVNVNTMAKTMISGC
jgi:hypothetical protein